MLPHEPSTSLPMQPLLRGDLRSIRAAGVADVRLNGDRIEWIPMAAPGAQWMPEGERAEKSLSTFCELGQRPSAEKVLDFVRRFGVLELVEGGRPACGLQGLHSVPQLSESWNGVPVRWEPISAYVAYAQSALAIRQLASKLWIDGNVDTVAVIKDLGFPASRDLTRSAWFQATGEWQAAADETVEEWAGRLESNGLRWDHLLHYDPVGIARGLAFSWSDAWFQPAPTYPKRFALTGELQSQWIKPSGLTPMMDWSEDRPRFGLGISELVPGAPPLFRVLTLQLVAAVLDSENDFVCFNCGVAGYSSRRPRADQPVLCEACRESANAIRVRRHRARKRANGQLES